MCVCVRVCVIQYFVLSYGKGTNEIHFGDYLCRGNESGLLECGINIHKTGSCNHEYDVGLSCSRESLCVCVCLYNCM